MKVSTTLAAVLLTFSVGSAYAATEVTSQQASNLQSLGTVSGSARVADLDQAVKAIAQKAESQHATYYRVIAADSNDSSNNWRIAAELYR